MGQAMGDAQQCYREWCDAGRLPDGLGRVLEFGHRLDVASLFDAITADMWYRWSSLNEPALADEYFRRFPSIQASKGRELVACEFANTKLHRGQADAGDFARRYPDLPLDPYENFPSLTANGLQIVSELGRGKFGSVYFAVEELTRRQVAVKFPAEEVRGDENLEARFRKEIQIIASLSHPGIVKLFSADRSAQGDLFFVMEYVNGKTLREYVRDNRLTHREVALLMAKIAGSIDYAHGERVIHRDLKPENVLVTESGEPRVTDFGLARIIQDDRPASAMLTASDTALGTIGYMAPEQLFNAREASGPADVFSIGAMLYEILTGQIPFAADGEKGVLARLTTFEGLEDPRKLHSDVPRDLAVICMRCLFRTPEKRLTARTLRDELRRYGEGHSSALTPIGRLESIKDRNPRGLKQMLAGATVAVLILFFAGTALAISAWNRGQSSRENVLISSLDAELSRLNQVGGASSSGLQNAITLLQEIETHAPDQADGQRQRYREAVLSMLRNQLFKKERLTPSDIAITERAIESLQEMDPEAAAWLSRELQAIRDQFEPYFRGQPGDWPKDQKLTAFEIGDAIRRRTGSNDFGPLPIPSSEPAGRGLRLNFKLDHWNHGDWIVLHTRAKELIEVTSIAFPKTNEGTFTVGTSDGRVLSVAISSGVPWESHQPSPSPVVDAGHATSRRLRAVAHADGTIFVHEKDATEPTRTVRSQLKQVTGLCLSPDGSKLAVWCDLEPGHQLAILDIAAERWLALPQDGPGGSIASAVWVSNTILLTGESTGAIFKWIVEDSVTRTPLVSIEHGVEELSLQSESSVFVVDRHGAVASVHVPSGRVQSLEMLGQVSCVTVGPNQSLIVGRDNGELAQFGSDGKEICQWNGFLRGIVDVSFDTVSQRWVSAIDQTGTARMYDLKFKAAVASPSRFLWHGYSFVLEYRDDGTHVSLLADGQLEQSRVLPNVNSGAQVQFTQSGNTLIADIGTETRILYEDVLAGWRAGDKIALDFSPDLQISSLLASSDQRQQVRTRLSDADSAYANDQRDEAIDGYQALIDDVDIPEADRREARLKLALCLTRKSERRDDAWKHLDLLTGTLQPNSIEPIALLYLLEHYAESEDATKAQVYFDRLQRRYTFDEAETGDAISLRSRGMQHVIKDLENAVGYLSKAELKALLAYEPNLLAERRLASRIADFCNFSIRTKLKRKSDLMEVQWFDRSDRDADAKTMEIATQCIDLLQSSSDPRIATDFGDFARVVERYCWLSRMEGNSQNALKTIEWALELVASPPPPLLTLEYARTLVSVGNETQARRILDDLVTMLVSKPGGDAFYGEYAQASEMLGFLATRQGNPKAAQQYWQRGQHQQWQALRSKQGLSSKPLLQEQPIPLGHHIALKVLLNQLIADDLATVASRYGRRYYFGVMWVAPQYLAITKDPAAVEIIEDVAFKRVSFPQCLLRPAEFAIEAAIELKTRTLDESEQRLIEQTVDKGIEVYFSSDRKGLSLQQAGALYSLWEATRPPDVKAMLHGISPELSAPAAYFVGLRWLTDEETDTARECFEIAQTTATENGLTSVVELSERELKRLPTPTSN